MNKSAGSLRECGRQRTPRMRSHSKSAHCPLAALLRRALIENNRHLQELRSNSITRFEMLAIIHKCDRFKRNNKALAYLSTLN
ncbi:MAG: hypothetical protein AB4426_29950, partial [Xenococcaceae cyanobacterium]